MQIYLDNFGDQYKDISQITLFISQYHNSFFLQRLSAHFYRLTLKKKNPDMYVLFLLTNKGDSKHNTLYHDLVPLTAL